MWPVIIHKGWWEYVGAEPIGKGSAVPVTRRMLTLAVPTAIAFGASRSARAEPLPQPAGKPILTISGLITAHNRGQDAVFDRPMLEALGWSSIRTRTPWYNGIVLFEGVLMEKLYTRVGGSGETAFVAALNDYTTEIPTSDFARFGVVLALKRDGKYMPVSDKGPLFIVYPYDSNPVLQSQKYYSRSAWQVAHMRFE